MYINIPTDSAKIFLPSHHACKRTPGTSKLVPLHCTLDGGQGDDFEQLSRMGKSIFLIM